MSSKIYSRDDGQAAERLLWTRAGPDSGNAADPAGNAAAGDPSPAQMAQEAERRLQQARQEGFQQGLASAKAETAAEFQALTKRVAETIAELAEIRPRLRRQSEADLIQLALAIARRILHRELAVDPDALRGLVQAALEKLQEQEICRVRVHPSQEALLRSLLQRHPLARGVEFLPDPTLDRGAAVFETARGNLDASVETQLREIEQGLADRLRHHS